MNRTTKKPMRRSIFWLTCATWVLTALLVFVLWRLHPPTIVHGDLLVSELAFRTHASKVLSPIDNEQVLIAGLEHAAILGTVQRSGVSNPIAELSLDGAEHSACSFWNVRSSAFELADESVIHLAWSKESEKGEISLSSDGTMRGTLTGQPPANGLEAGFSCSQMRTDSSQDKSEVSGRFDAGGGTSVAFLTRRDSSITIQPSTEAVLLQAAVAIEGPLRLSRVDVGSRQESSALLPRTPGNANSITFDTLGRTITIDEHDIVQFESRPTDGFWLRNLTADAGLRIDLHGTVSRVEVGPGPSDMHNILPSALDFCLGLKGMLGLIPALATTLLGILERMGLLPKK